jgi:hypothetical protein
MSNKLLRVGGGYTNKCTRCEFNIKEIERCKQEIHTLKDEINTLRQIKLDLEEKITIMIEDKAIEDLDVFSKLEQLNNLINK